MKFDPQLELGTELSNSELRDLFGCSLYSGMNRSLKTNTLALVSNRIKSIYQDRIDGQIIHYTGMGQVGDQTLTSQNKTLNESNINNVDVHLFEVLTPQIYTYVGPVELAANPYQETQEDSEGKDRKVWMFPLRLKNGLYIEPVKIEKIKDLELTRERLVQKLSRDELLHRAKLASKNPGAREVKTKQYQRNEYVAEEARRRANGICQLCEQTAPFKSKNGIPYLEVHHVMWLANGGEDSLENTVALCPNCHRKMHQLNLEADKTKLIEKIKITTKS